MKRSTVTRSKESYVVLPADRRKTISDGVSDLQPQLLTALLAYRDGDFAVRLPSNWVGIAGKIADAFNDVVSFNQRLRSEMERVSRAVGKEGKLRQRVNISQATGDWANKVEAINTLIDDLVWPTTEVTR